MTQAQENAQERVRKQAEAAQNWTLNSVRTWNELAATTADMAFDVVLKSWDYNRSVRDSAEAALKETVNTQRKLAAEVTQVFQGYTYNVNEILSRTSK